MKILILSLTTSAPAFADTTAIIGGIDLTLAPPYAALVSSTGNLTPLSLGGPTITGIIQSVSMNSSGISLIGGQESDSSTGHTPAYGARISSTGAITSLPITGLPALHGIIYGASINTSGNGIIGGRDTTGPIYAALVSPSGSTISPLTFPPLVATGGVINSVAINDSSTSLIGGQAFYAAQPAFAAYVSPSGVMTPLTLTGGIGTTGAITSVAINSSGNGLIGGQDQTGSQPAYAAFVTSGGTVAPLTFTGGVATNGHISSVSLNDSDNGLIGGQDLTGSQPAYAALVSSSGTVAPLTLTGGMTTNGIINSVAINSSGNGIIGGEDLTGSQPPYAALISTSGTVTPLTLGPVSGNILSVAINAAGNGIIGGQDYTGSQPAYAALFTSSGTVIPLTFTGGMAINGWINSVAWIESASPNPQPLFTIPTASLSGNNLVFAHYINTYSPDDAFYFIPAFLDGTLDAALESAAPTRNALSIYTASNNLFILSTSFANHIRNQQHHSCPCDAQCTPFSIWFDGIGAWSHQKAQHQTVEFDPSTGGAILACDRLITPQLRVGGGAAYLFTHIHEINDQGQSDIHQEDAFVYGTWDNQQYYVDLLVLGGAVQINQVRHTTMTGFSFRSTSHPNGWQLLPHLELGFNRDVSYRFSLNPFVMLDWANAWQESYKEKGESPFNAAQKSYYGSLLRTEAGFRFYETLNFSCWNVIFQEKISYVNRESFDAGRVHAFLVGAPGSFTVETLSSPKNLGVAQLSLIFDPLNGHLPTTTLFYQGEFGQRYQSHQFNVELAWQF